MTRNSTVLYSRWLGNDQEFNGYGIIDDEAMIRNSTVRYSRWLGNDKTVWRENQEDISVQAEKADMIS